MTARQTILRSAGPSHDVVQFDCDECIATITHKQLVRPPLPLLRDQYWMNRNGEDYSAKILVIGDLATAKKAKAEILQDLDNHTDDEVSQDHEDVANDDYSPLPKKRSFGFGRAKDTKKSTNKAKKVSPKKRKIRKKNLL